jgi:predicted DNA-binding transcriptional regulator AlpA
VTRNKPQVPANLGAQEQEHLLTPAQVADRLAISPRTLWRLVASGAFPQPIRYNRKLIRWRSTAVAAYLDGLEGGG